MKHPDAIRPALAAVLLACLAAPAAQAQQAGEILQRTAETYRGLQAYHLEGAVSIEMHAPAGTQAMEVSVVMAEREPDQLRAEVSSQAMEMILVTRDDTTWLYIPNLNQYMKRVGGGLPVLGEGSPIPDLLGEYRKLDENVHRVSLLREEDVEIDGTAHAAYVLDVEYLPRSTPAGADSSRKTLWVDQQRLVVLRDETHAHVSSSPFGGAVTVDETTTYSRVQIGEPLPDSLFAFHPPPGAEEVRPEDIFGDALAGGSGGGGSLTGRTAENFTLQNLDGEEVSLDAMRGQVVLINFWATWCGPCRMEMPALDELYRAHAGEGLVVLAVDIAEPAAQVASYVEEFGYTFPILLDPDGRVGALYGATAIPTTVIVGTEGVITHHFVGARPASVFRNALRELGFQ